MGETGLGTSLATCPLAWVPFPWLGPDTSFAHTAVGREGACRPSSCCPVLYLPGHWASFPDLFLHSTAKGYDRTTPWPMALLLRPVPSSWGVPPDQWQGLNRPCQPMAALLGLPWANDVASSTLCPSSMCSHCREGDWDQRGGDNGEPHFWPCI